MQVWSRPIPPPDLCQTTRTDPLGVACCLGSGWWWDVSKAGIHEPEDIPVASLPPHAMCEPTKGTAHGTEVRGEVVPILRPPHRCPGYPPKFPHAGDVGRYP